MPIKANTPKLAYVLNLAKLSLYSRPSVCQSGLTSPSYSLALAVTRYCPRLFSPLLPSLLLFLCSFLVSFVNHSSQCSYLLALPLIALALTPPAPLLLPRQFYLLPPALMHVPYVPLSSDLSVNCNARTCSLSPSLPSLLMLLCFFNVSFVL